MVHEMKLSPREQQVLALLSTGKSYEEVGEYLGVSRNTVRTRIRYLYPKLNAHSAEEAVRNYNLLSKETVQLGTRAEKIERDLSTAMGKHLPVGRRNTNHEYLLALKSAVAEVLADMLPENHTNPKGEQ